MALKGFSRRFKPLEILNEEDIEAIHRATLDVLWKTGVVFDHENALKLFQNNDCKVDFENKRVRIPPGLAEECIRKCPSSFRVKARNPENDLVIGGNTLYFASFPGMNTVDINSWEPKKATRKDYYDFVTVLDALENLHWLWAYPYFGYDDVPSHMAILESVAAKIRNSTKFQLTAGTLDNIIWNIQMAKAVDVEIMSPLDCSAPLTYYRDQVDQCYKLIEAGFPVQVGPSSIYGATAPATMAGSTVSNNVEMIAGVVLIQLIKPSSRVFVRDFTFPQNMQTGSPDFGQIGISLHQVMFNQIWRWYSIPMGTISIGCSNSKRIDFQSGYEKSIGVLTSALSGTNLICLHGGIYGELTAHPIQAILDDDIAGMVGRFMEGVEINDETLAVELIESVGPIPGYFLDKEHTRKWWQKETYIPKATDRLTYPEWVRNGKKSCLDFAQEKMEEILSTQHPMSLSPGQEADIERILKEAKEYYRKKEAL